LKAKPDDDLTALFVPVLQQKGVRVRTDLLKKVVGLIKERLVFPQEFWDQAHYFFEPPQTYDQQLLKKAWKEDTPQIMQDMKELFRGARDFSSAALEALVKNYLEPRNVGFGRVAAPLRLLVVGSGIGPHLFDILEIIGKDETIKRISKGLELFS
jgi:glutamyl-tRNA synthetase